MTARIWCATRSAVAVLLVSLTAVAATLSVPAAQAVGTGCETSNRNSAPPGYVSAKNYGATGNGRTDDTNALTCALAAAARAHVGLWLPTGRYEVSRSIVIPAGTKISGARTWATPVVVDASVPGVVFGDSGYNAAAGSVLISDIAFNNVTVNFHGPWTMSIVRVIFTHTFVDTTSHPTELEVADIAAGTVSDSIFMHGNGLGAIPFSTYRANNLTVTRNIVGLNLGQLAWLGTWPGYRAWVAGPSTVTSKLRVLQVELRLRDDQGQFRTGFYGDQVNNVTVDSNIVLGSMATQGGRDHVAYFWGTGRGKYTRNWVRGWPADASGGIKVRNGATILVGGNTITGTGIMTYVYGNNPDWTLHDVSICNNRINVMNGRLGNGYEGIMYWQTVTPKLLADNVIFGNVFADPTHTASVGVGSTGFNVYASNLYADTRHTVPVSGPAVAKGLPDAAHRAQCSELAPPNYSIPTA